MAHIDCSYYGFNYVLHSLVETNYFRVLFSQWHTTCRLPAPPAPASQLLAPLPALPRPAPPGVPGSTPAYLGKTPTQTVCTLPDRDVGCAQAFVIQCSINHQVSNSVLPPSPLLGSHSTRPNKFTMYSFSLWTYVQTYLGKFLNHIFVFHFVSKW